MQRHLTNKPWIVIFGATGSGKSSLAVHLAHRIDRLLHGPIGRCHIVSCDSVAVYKGFDIGSAKPTLEQRKEVPHHLVDVLDWHEEFDAECFRRAAQKAMESIWDEQGIPIVVGGTGLYLRALYGDRFDLPVAKDAVLRARLQSLPLGALMDQLREVNPARADQLHPNDRVRLIRAIEIATSLDLQVTSSQPDGGSFLKPTWTLAIDPPRPLLHQNIGARTEKMLREGLVDEVKGLIKQGVDPQCKPMGSIGYRQTWEVLSGALKQELLSERISAATRQYAKRQCTWFKKTTRDLTLATGEIPGDDVILKYLLG